MQRHGCFVIIIIILIIINIIIILIIIKPMNMITIIIDNIERMQIIWERWCRECRMQQQVRSSSSSSRGRRGRRTMVMLGAKGSGVSYGDKDGEEETKGEAAEGERDDGGLDVHLGRRVVVPDGLDQRLRVDAPPGQHAVQQPVHH